MELSIRLIIEIQKYKIFSIAWAFSYGIFVPIYGYIFFAMTLRANQENNYCLLFGVMFLHYIHAILKLTLVGSRPIFHSSDIRAEYCVCDYGMPSAHGILALGTLLLIYFDIIHNHKISKYRKYYMKIGIGCIAIINSIGRLYLGAHSINQIVLGWSIGITCFLFLRQINDYVQKSIIWPIFYKDNFKNTRAIFHILFHFMWTNYLIFWVWTYRYTRFEVKENPFFEFKNCLHCLDKIERNFSCKIVKESSLFNLFFGMMIGIYISRIRFFAHRGFFAERNVGLYILRLMLLSLMMAPLVIGFILVFDNLLLKFIRLFFLCIVCGILMTTVFFKLLTNFDLDIDPGDDMDDPGELVFIQS